MYVESTHRADRSGGTMTRSGLWWLMHVAALLPLIRVPSFCQHTESRKILTSLLAIKSNKSGLEVHTLFPENRGSIVDNKPSQWPDNKLEPQTLFISGHSLSSECGDQYFQCQELLVINAFFQVRNDSREFNIVFVPLKNGILLLSYCYDSNNMTLERSIFTVNSSNCSPTVFYNINSKIYTVCISSYEEYHNMAVYEVRLNLTGSMIKFEGASLIGPLTSISISNSLSSSNFSNFIIVGHMIIFAIGNTIVVLDVFDMTQTQQYPELPQCAQINKLVYTRNQLVAYCTDRYSCFDPVYGDWTNVQLFSSNGVPYICPGSNYRATLFTNGSLQLSLRDLLTNTINNVNISSGICFESQNRTYFAYSDQQHNNVYVYDFFTQNYFPVSPYDCTCQDCPQLLLLEKQYLVIRDANHDLVLDTTTNFSLIINISSGIADILAVLHSNVYGAITPSPPIISTLINSLDLTSVIRSTRPAPIIIRSTSAVAQVSAGNTLSTTQEHTYAITASSLITVSGTTRKFSPGMNPGTTSTLVSSPEYTYASAITPSAPLFPIHSAVIATISNSNNITPVYSLTAFTTLLPNDNVTVIHTNIPTSVTTHNNSVGIILTVAIGLFVIIVILVAAAAGFSIQHWRRKR